MERTRDTLGKIQAISVIFASIAVPLLVAYFTWQTQKQINEQTLQKDYLEIAVKVLNDKSTPQDEEIREWAQNVFKSTQDGNQSTVSKIQYIPIAQNIKIPESLMKPALSWKPLEEKETTTMNDLMINYVENIARFRENALMVETLQKIVVVLTEKETSLKNSSSGSANPHAAP